jgi:hypothetical protein
MERSLSRRIADVCRLVEVARELSHDGALIEPLVRSTGLSPQGVTLALAEHLETSPAEADVRRLVEAAGTAEAVYVVLSSNVFVAALRAVAVARAAATRVTVVPSSREPVFAQALVERAADPALTLDPSFTPESLGEGFLWGQEIHVYGRDETIAELRSRVPTGIHVRGHGTGLGIACVTGPDLKSAALAIARDVVPFDQRGCLSPRVVLFLGGEAAAEEFCAELDQALAAFEERVPRGLLEGDEWEAASRYVSTIAYAGRVWRGSAHVVGLAPRSAPLWVPPAGRHVHVAVVPRMSDARVLVSKVARFITAVGSDSATAGKELVDHPVRLSALGEMQRPPLDGPVDLRG